MPPPTPNLPAQTGARLATATGALAARAGWAAYDVSAHEAARSLFRLALHTAGRAGDPNLRAHTLADVAAQHNHLGYHHDALDIIRLAEGDERLAPPLRMLLHTVKARIYAAHGDADHTRRQIEQAETIYADPGQQADLEPGWVATLHHPGHLYAATGHAMATLASHTGNHDHTQQAQRRLAPALDVLDPATHTRTHALAAARLATLQLTADGPDQALHTTRVAIQSAGRVRSARLTHSLTTLRTIAGSHPDQPAAQALVAEISTVIGPSHAAGPGAPDQPEPA